MRILNPVIASQSNNFVHNSGPNKYEPSSFDNNRHNLSNNNAHLFGKERVYNHPKDTKNAPSENDKPPYTGHPNPQFISFSNAPQIRHHQSNVLFPAPVSVSYGSVSVPSLQDIIGAHVPVPATYIQATSLVSSPDEGQTDDYPELARFVVQPDIPVADTTEIENQSDPPPHIRQRFIDTLLKKKEQSIEQADWYLKQLIQYDFVSPDLSFELFGILYPYVPDVNPTTYRVPSSSSTSLPAVDNQDDDDTATVVGHENNNDIMHEENVNDINLNQNSATNALGLKGVPNDHIFGHSAAAITAFDQNIGSVNGCIQNYAVQPQFNHECNFGVDPRAIMSDGYYEGQGIQHTTNGLNIPNAFGNNVASVPQVQNGSFQHADYVQFHSKPEPIEITNTVWAQGFPFTQRSNSIDSTSSIPSLSISNSASPEPYLSTPNVGYGQIPPGQYVWIKESIEDLKGKAPAPAPKGRKARQMRPYTGRKKARKDDNTNRIKGPHYHLEHNKLVEMDKLDPLLWIIDNMIVDETIQPPTPLPTLTCPICEDSSILAPTRETARHIMTHSVLSTITCPCQSKFARIDSLRRHLVESKATPMCSTRREQADIEEKIFAGFVNELRYLKSVGRGNMNDEAFLGYYRYAVEFRKACQVLGYYAVIGENADEELQKKVEFVNYVKETFTPEYFATLKRDRTQEKRKK